MSDRPEQYYPALDGVRGFAALLVVWYHFLQFAPIHGRVLSAFSSVTDCTWVGVDLFFVLSGFLITGILVDAKSRAKYFRTFYSRRVLRIFPLYYGVLVVAFWIVPLLNNDPTLGAYPHVYFWTYTSNFYLQASQWKADGYLTHLWTLAIEEQFYFIWPLVVFLATDLDRLRRGIGWAFVGVMGLRLFLSVAGVTFQSLYLNTFTHCDPLLLGAYLVLAIRTGRANMVYWLHPPKSVALIVIVLAYLLATFAGFGAPWYSIPVVAFARSVLLFTLLSLIFVWIVAAAATKPKSLAYRLFSQPVMRWYGKYSYALYVLHVPVGFVLLKSYSGAILPHLWSPIAPVELLLIYLAVSTACAFLSWHLFEKHFLKLKRYFQYGTPKQTETALIAMSEAS